MLINLEACSLVDAGDSLRFVGEILIFWIFNIFRNCPFDVVMPWT